MTYDFTLTKYRQLCEAIIHNGYATTTVSQYLTQPDEHDMVIILRHDVDRRPKNALYMAELEYKLNLRTTYYFRTTSRVFRPHLMKQIAVWGHEIGYHYETLSTCSGDYTKAINLFEQELALFREIYPIKTIAMHGRPLSPYDNRDLWQQYDYRDYALLGEAYLDIDYTQVGYLTDTGRTWHGSRRNLRDKPPARNAIHLPPIYTTDDLIALIDKREYSQLVIQTHPERWSWSVWTYSYSWLFDSITNLLKVFLSTARF